MKSDHPEQPQLWYESIDDATRYDVAFLGGFKRVGAMLRPDMMPDKAGEWLSSCLNHERREKMDINQYAMIWREAKRKGSLVGISQVNRECECADPIPVEPEDQQLQLVKEFNNGVALLSKIADRLESMGMPVGIKAVK